MVTRLQLMLPDLPDVGVWTLSSTGYYAAAELATSIQIVMSSTQQTGLIPEATLAIEPREVKQQGQPTKKFVVPVLRFADTLSTFLGGGGESPVSLPTTTPAGTLLPGRSDGEGGDVTVLPSGTDPAPVAPLPEPDFDQPVEAEVVEITPAVENEAEAWSSLYQILEEDPSEGVMDKVEERVRRLFRYMDEVGLWGDHNKARHAAVQKHYNTVHVGDLRKAELNQFAEMTFAAAKARVELEGVNE